MTDKELQEIRASYTEGNTQYRDIGKCTLQDILKLFSCIDNLQSENTRLKAERDAAVALHKDSAKELRRIRAERDKAVEDLRHYPGITPCEYCKHFVKPGVISEYCKLFDRSCFEWRGLEK